MDENGSPTDEAPVISVYTHDTFTDLCRGPHVAHTGEVNPDALRLLSVAGAYWRGDENQPMLQRIYGTAWRSAEELENYLELREEAERRDHRRLGRELELFHIDPTAPGMPYWLPNGTTLLNQLLSFWREEHEIRGYQEILSPLVNDRRLYETSGHWEHYRDSMFLIPVNEHTTYCLKPMNCPNAMVVFNLKTRSYRDLPLRLSDSDTLHRHELSGTLHGLLRVQEFKQDDAHIFVTEDQIDEEYARIFNLTERFYSIFGLSYRFRLGTRPADFVGDVETWDKAESILRRILDHHAGAGSYEVEVGDGAFYGPKVDIVMQDALGRDWQMGTIQLDFQLPRRFGCKYTAADGTQKSPIVIHHVIYGSLERFIGLVIEHTAGALPAWIAPVQAVVIPISEKQADYARQVRDQLRFARIRVELDDSGERMNAKIRSAQLRKIPYMLIVGGREAENGTVSVRLRTEDDLGAMPITDFIHMARSVIDQKALELT